MERLLLYMVQTTVCTGLFWWIYGRIIESRTGYDQARFYLLSAVLVSVVIPLLEIPVFPGETIMIPAMDRSIVVLPVDAMPSVVPVNVPMEDVSVSFKGEVLVKYLYVGVLAGYLLLLSYRLVSLFCLVKRGERTKLYFDKLNKTVKVVLHSDITLPFSFFRYIFLPDGMQEEQKRTVVLHEQSHICHGHSVDRVLLEIFQAIMWYNPFIRSIRRKMIEIHEFQADRDVLDSGVELVLYRELLLQQTMGAGKHIVNNLHQSFIKKRFIMMTEFRKSKYALLRIGVVLPVTAMLMLCFSFVKKDAVFVEERNEIKTEFRPENNGIMESREKDAVHVAVQVVSDTATVENEELSSDSVVLVKGGKMNTKADIMAMIMQPRNKSITEIVELMEKYNSVQEQQSLARRMKSGEIKPLVVLNGKCMQVTSAPLIDPDDIASYSVLKDTTAIAIFGEAAKDGAISITTEGYSRNKDTSRMKPISVLINGKEVSWADFQKLGPADIANVRVLKRVREVADTFMMTKTILVTTENTNYSVDIHKISVMIDREQSDWSDFQKLGPESIANINIFKNEEAGAIGPVKTILVTTEDYNRKLIYASLPKSPFDPERALIIIDGKKMTKEDFGKLKPEEIKTFRVLKIEEAKKKYGEKQSRYGVLEVITNR